MPINPGSRLGPYEITGTLGAGGMGEVYRARDTRLKRDVAIKVLPAEFASDPDRLARFEREAELLASLNHSNIAGVYGLETGVAQSAIVLELVEGDTLEQLIARGPIALADALPIARQLSEALEAAHDKGIIHRDLKPANIKITPDGRVKVLDFGLAKLLLPAAALQNDGASVFTNSPTLSVHATYAGTILGTAAYMSPEQARGKHVDQRTDIWAFGCVLFEMLTGKPPFEVGETVSDAIAAVLKNDPPWQLLPADTPHVIRALMHRCLQKDPQKRLPHIGVARLDIDESLASPVANDRQATFTRSTRTSRWRAILFGIALGITAALGGLGLLQSLTPRTGAPIGATRVEMKLGGGLSLVPTATLTRLGPILALSPDGTAVVFVGQTKSEFPQLYLRRLNTLDPIPLAGTTEGVSPFFSPRGDAVAFFAAGKLKKVHLAGGPAVTIADAPDHRGGTWLEDDTIVFAATPIGELLRVSSNGGPPQVLTRRAQGEVTHRWPHALPGNRAVLYEAHSARAGHDDGTIVVERLDDHVRTVVHRGGFDPRFIRSGSLVTYVNRGTLFAIPFDVVRLQTTGQPRPILEGVSSNSTSGYANLSASTNGSLVYLPGSVVNPGAGLDWIDRKGQVVPLRTAALVWGSPAFSPDGRRLAVQVSDGGQGDIWILDIERGDFTRLTSTPANDMRPVWTPDGRRITFASNRESATGSTNLFWQPFDASTPAQRLTTSVNVHSAATWHPSGRFLAFLELQAQSQNDIWILPMDGSEASGWKPGTPTKFLDSPFNDLEPAFSPDGKWLAYASTETGSTEVYVRPFPGPGGRVPISTGGGHAPTWSTNGRELLYINNGQLMVVTYTAAGDVFRADKPRPWTNVQLSARIAGVRSFALHPDGNRVVGNAVSLRNETGGCFGDPRHQLLRGTSATDCREELTCRVAHNGWRDSNADPSNAGNCKVGDKPPCPPEGRLARDTVLHVSRVLFCETP